MCNFTSYFSSSCIQPMSASGFDRTLHISALH
ncbi:hypothetical protein EG68_11351 [Paragonimus skrjabini miyazakii]|uniref:Uncharacterized protein n=1 Tax=Paragonimus skrjabini miyazakii TaxID=59628 RepID=A0A8S9YH56_9TREM|nr:hypothetical protein EG68_11351 [Paragonimus skrjabini miyazakii]